MSSGITKGLTDLLGIETNAGDAELQQAIAALQSVGVPTADQLNLPELEKYVSAGVLSPSQYQAILANPDIYSETIAANQDNSGSEAQKAALQQLGSIVNSGGSSAINDATLKNNLAQTNQAMQASRQGISSDAQQRGVSGGGLEFISQLMNEQSNAQNANLSATNAAADNAKLALQALTQQGQLGGQMQGHSNQSAQSKAEAARQIAEYNSQLQSMENQYNTDQANKAQATNLGAAQDLSNKNTELGNFRTQYNAQVPQQIFQDQMSKAGATANAYGNYGQLQQQQAASDAALTGGLIGAGATLGGKYAMKDKTKTGYAHGGEVNGGCYAQGGEVHDHELCMKAGGSVPGDESGMPPMVDDESQDVVDAHLSPGEIVLPRSVAQAPNAPQKAEQFVSQTTGQAPQMPGATVGSFAEILSKLEENGIELRLAAKGM